MLSSLGSVCWGSVPCYSISPIRETTDVSPKHRLFSVSKHPSLLVSLLLFRAMLSYCWVILSRGVMPQAITFCAFSMVGHFHRCPHRVVVPQLAGARHLQPQGVVMGLVCDTRSFAMHFWHWCRLILLFVPRLRKHKHLLGTWISGLRHLISRSSQ